MRKRNTIGLAFAGALAVLALGGQQLAGGGGAGATSEICDEPSCAPKTNWDCVHGDISKPHKCDPQDPCCVICPE